MRWTSRRESELRSRTWNREKINWIIKNHELWCEKLIISVPLQNIKYTCVRSPVATRIRNLNTQSCWNKFLSCMLNKKKKGRKRNSQWTAVYEIWAFELLGLNLQNIMCTCYEKYNLQYKLYEYEKNYVSFGWYLGSWHY